MNWYIDVLKKYAVFSGRAGRKEFWMFILFNVIVEIFLWGIEFIVAHTLERNIIANLVILIISLIYTLGILTPSIAVTVRRLHDTGRSGWWVLIGLVPIIGTIVLVVFTVQDSQQGYKFAEKSENLSRKRKERGSSESVDGVDSFFKKRREEMDNEIGS